MILFVFITIVASTLTYAVHGLYVTGFWKTDRNVTLDLFHFIGPANGYPHTLHIHTAIVSLVDWSAFLE